MQPAQSVQQAHTNSCCKQEWVSAKRALPTLILSTHPLESTGVGATRDLLAQSQGNALNVIWGHTNQALGRLHVRNVLPTCTRCIARSL